MTDKIRSHDSVMAACKHHTTYFKAPLTRGLIDALKDEVIEDFNIIATADNLMIGRAGYSAAAMFYHDHMITLQQGTYVIMDSKRDGLPKPLIVQNFKELREMEQALNSGMPVDVEQVIKQSKAS